jgi:hypothetical protein
VEKLLYEAEQWRGASTYVWIYVEYRKMTLIVFFRALTLSCAALALVGTASCSARNENLPMAGLVTVIKVSICEILSDPQHFDRQVVKFEAGYESDGLHGAVLIGPKCLSAGGILPSGPVHEVPGGRALLDAELHGSAGNSGQADYGGMDR